MRFRLFWRSRTPTSDHDAAPLTDAGADVTVMAGEQADKTAAEMREGRLEGRAVVVP